MSDYESAESVSSTVIRSEFGVTKVDPIEGWHGDANAPVPNSEGVLDNS